MENKPENKRLLFHTVPGTLLILFSLVFHLVSEAQTNAPLRRPISPSSPMWLIHIDTWNWPDPQKIIDLIPADIRPYVVMNISLSISHNATTGKWNIVEYGYETAKSWLRTCAENQMWATIQPSSGGFSHFSDFDLSVYEEFYTDYPNFLGFNYCEQFWGFDDKWSVTYPQRLAHWVNLMKLSQKYGGYLIVSFTHAYYAASMNPVAMMKRDPNFAAICKQDPEHFILCEKFTMQNGFHDDESTCEGAYLSGFSGHYGIRFDQCGWVAGDTINEKQFPVAAGAIPVVEHVMLTGETVIDGPELIWQQCTREISTAQTPDGYTKRQWEYFPQFNNISIDIFRKILDGTVRILSRKEVIDRTKVVIINDVNSGDDRAVYSSPETLFDGLYKMDDDGTYLNNKSWFKKTGRYPAIPTVFQLSDADASSFQVKVSKSAYPTRWPTVSAKVTEFNNLFPQEYTGDLYAARSENGLVTYNPHKTGQTASATAKSSIPFKYNTCDHLELTYSRYSMGIIKEYSDSLTFYLTNYDNYYTNLKADTIKIYGSSSQPTYSYMDRAIHQASTVTSSWLGGVFTLVVTHNGPLDITVNCSGSATGRLTSYTTANVITPDKPALYTGLRQYETETFEYKSINTNYTNGVNSGISNYTGQGFMNFGTNSAASIRKTVNVLRKGTYHLNIRYAVTGGNVTTIDLYINGTKVSTPTFTKTATLSSWGVYSQSITLNAGSNTIMFRANTTGTYNIYFDNISITQGNSSGIYHFNDDVATTAASTPAAELITVQSGTAGVISYTDGNSVTSNCFKTYSAGATNETGVADLALFPPLASDYYVVWKEYYGTAGGKKGILLRGSGNNGSCPFALGMKQGYLFITLNNNDSTVTLLPYTATTSGLSARPIYTSGFKIKPNEPCWYRASATGDSLKFECSKDSITWEGGTTAIFTDSIFTSGSTELVWGLDSNNFTWIMDNISYLSKNISVSKYSINGLGYTQYSGPGTAQSFTISGNALTDNMIINASNNFEISLTSGSGYASSLTLMQNSGTIPSTTIYVRLKTGLTIDAYSGEITISSNGTSRQTVNLEGDVVPLPVSKQYNFSNDVATTSAKTPPALYTAIAQGNSATAGVVSYTDSKNVTSNMFRPYSGGNRNVTGVVDLNLFSRKSTDYSVTWKQCVGSAGTDYKAGILLRGDTSKVGDATTGYVQGLMQGYLFIVYTAGAGTAHSEFRTYKSTSAYNSLSMLSNTSVSTLKPAAGQPVWYRASVSGSSLVSLKLEYSTDSITWNTGTSTTDNTASFTSGATQIVWGLGAGNFNFFMDNITFYGVESSLGSPPEFTVWNSSLSGFNYFQDFGPSASQSFSVSGSALINDIVVNAPENFEVSLSSNTGYASSVTLTKINGILAQTPVFVRLKAGLAVNSYSGNISITSTGVPDKTVSLSGAVNIRPALIVSTDTLKGFSYIFGSGPCPQQTLTISGSSLTDNIAINTPANYEISLNPGSAYTSSLTLQQSSGTVSSTDVYVRLKEGLAVGTYNGDILITSTNAVNDTISLNGSVVPYTGVISPLAPAAIIVSKEYYTLTGQKINNSDNLRGVFIVITHLSDGTITKSKIWIDNP